jgi:5-methyltetrahydropteroyltriglutamate--homocysteine methyltransferase
MLRADRRFVVSHVGSMVRPPAMIPYLQKAQAGEPYDKTEFESCLTDSVIEGVRLQAEAGIDVVSDGEYGKSGTWPSTCTVGSRASNGIHSLKLS